MAILRIGGIPFQPHVSITHPERLGRSLVLRIPEFVKAADDSRVECPSRVRWSVVEPERVLHYSWDVETARKTEWGTDFSGTVQAENDLLRFEVTCTNVGAAAHPAGVYLFCLQAGADTGFHDPDGLRTYARRGGRWVSVNTLQNGSLPKHRMCSYPVAPAGVDCNLMAKQSVDGDWVLAIALDQCGHVSCNHQVWPSCIHANPARPLLAPGAAATARGCVYWFRGDLAAVLARVQRDFQVPGDSETE